MRNLVFFRQLIFCAETSRKCFLVNFQDYRFGELGLRVFRAAQYAIGTSSHAACIPNRMSRPSLSFHIKNIFGLCSIPKMIRINAKAIISFWTVMKNTWFGRNNFLSTYSPRNSMGCMIFSSKPKTSISPCTCASSPKPARICFFNFRPKSFRFFGGKIDRLLNFKNSIFSSLHKFVYVELLAVSRASYAGDGVFIVANLNKEGK